MKKIAFYIIFLFIFLISGQTQVIINEVMAYNTSTILNPQLGTYTDWIEIFNAGDEPYDLTYCSLSDNYDDPGKWIFPTGTIIDPGEYLIVWADQPQQPIAGLHACFKLDVSGELLFLANLGTGQMIDSITFSRQFENVSYGKAGTTSHSYYSNPTPGAENDYSSAYMLASGIKMDPLPGIYNGSQSVTLSWTVPDATIRYTIDGSEPDENSTIYNQPLQVMSNMVIRTKIWATGYEPGWIETGTYIIGQTFNLPVFSLTTDPPNLWDDYTGIYVQGLNGIPGYCNDQPMNFNQDWERPLSLEYFDLSGKRILQIDGGTKIFGGCSRGFEMKSLAFYARSLYGANEIRYPFFREKDIDWFKDLVFRNSGNDFQYTMIRDGVMQAVVKGQMDIDAQAFEPVHIFLNGEYWGIHNLREKLNENYIYSNYRIPPEEIDFIKNRGEVFAGTYTNYSQLNNYLVTNSLSSQEKYDWVASKIDVNEYMNYLMTQMFFGNDDWPGNNLRYWRQNTTDGKWRWILFDLDFGMGLYGFEPAQDMFTFSTAEYGPDWPNPPWSTLIIRRLFENEGFRDEFIRKYMMHLNTTFHEDRVVQVIDSIYGMIAGDFPVHINRWHQPWSIEQWEANIEQLREFARMRPGYVWQNMSRFFSLGDVIAFDIENTDTAGIVRVNGFEIPSKGLLGKFFKNYPAELEALPAAGNTFERWEISPSQSQKEVLFPSRSYWKYFNTGSYPGSGWYLPDYNDYGWEEGRAEFGYGDENETTVLDFGPDPNNKYTTYYFRNKFGLEELHDFTGFTIYLMRDDGAVVYLNGEEVLRSNMPDGEIGYDTYSSTAVGGDEENTFFEFYLEDLPVKVGSNTIAVEIHQTGPGSSDISFDLELAGNFHLTGETEYLYGSHLTFVPTEGILIKPVFKTSDELPKLIINEFMASNQNAYQDEAGEYEDWIEILNAGQQVVNLGGFYFTDDLTDPFKWKIPEDFPDQTTIHPGEYMVLFADEDTLQGPLHLNFKLGATGDQIGLSAIFRDEFIWIDSVVFGPQTTDLSFGRYPDGGSDWYKMVQYTPGAANLSTSNQEYEARHFQMELFPNPANDLLYIHIRNIYHYQEETSFELQLFDLTGRLILRQDLINPDTDFTHTIDLSMVPSGFYLLKAGNGNQEVIERLIIQ